MKYLPIGDSLECDDYRWNIIDEIDEFLDCKEHVLYAAYADSIILRCKSGFDLKIHEYNHLVSCYYTWGVDCWKTADRQNDHVKEG